MNRNMLFVLLLATGVVLAADEPKPERVTSSTEAQEQTKSEAERAASAPEAEAQTEEEVEADAGATEAQARTEEKAELGADASAPPSQKDDGAKLISGMSVLGNQEAPKSLVIVPWMSSEIGNSLGISTMLDDTRQPIDKEVFMRALSYYEIRSKTTP